MVNFVHMRMKDAYSVCGIDPDHMDIVDIPFKRELPPAEKEK